LVKGIAHCNRSNTVDFGGKKDSNHANQSEVTDICNNNIFLNDGSIGTKQRLVFRQLLQSQQIITVDTKDTNQLEASNNKVGGVMDLAL
jgi:hypothetical protein